jgi:hypothetical protein
LVKPYPRSRSSSYGATASPRLTRDGGRPRRVDRAIGAGGRDLDAAPVPASTPMWNLRQDRRVRTPCFSNSHSPGPHSFRPVLSTTRPSSRQPATGRVSATRCRGSRPHRSGDCASARSCPTNTRAVHRYPCSRPDGRSGPSPSVPAHVALDWLTHRVRADGDSSY